MDDCQADSKIAKEEENPVLRDGNNIIADFRTRVRFPVVVVALLKVLCFVTLQPSKKAPTVSIVLPGKTPISADSADSSELKHTQNHVERLDGTAKQVTVKLWSTLLILVLLMMSCKDKKSEAKSIPITSQNELVEVKSDTITDSVVLSQEMAVPTPLKEL